MLLPGTFGSLSANTGFTSAPASSPTDWGSQLGVGYKKGGNSQGSPELRNWIGHEILLCFLLHAVFWAGLTACTDRKLIAIWFQVLIVATRWVSFTSLSGFQRGASTNPSPPPRAALGQEGPFQSSRLTEMGRFRAVGSGSRAVDELDGPRTASPRGKRAFPM